MRRANRLARGIIPPVAHGLVRRRHHDAFLRSRRSVGKRLLLPAAQIALSSRIYWMRKRAQWADSARTWSSEPAICFNLSQIRA
jgi:hypothetical protein